jgi:alpha-D-xyloside xylohydrolase
MFSCSGKQVETLQNGVIVHITEAAPGKAKTVRVQVISDKIIRVTATPENKLPDVKSLMSIINTDKLKSNFEVTSDSNQVSIKTKALKAIVSLKTGEVEFTDSTGKTILAEKKGGKNFYPIDIEGKKMYSVRQEFETTSDEALYGLGENQNGITYIKGKDLDLTQVNTIAVVPFLVSTKGYGILWDNNSRTKFGDPRDYKQLSSLKLQ